MMMSKLGNLDAAQSTEYLTSILNGFKLEATDAIGVINKLTALDNAYATSVGEISAALQRSSNSAQQNGVSFDELASYIK
jgi:TP901 family phage tail tape measure protein